MVRDKGHHRDRVKQDHAPYGGKKKLYAQTGGGDDLKSSKGGASGGPALTCKCLKRNKLKPTRKAKGQIAISYEKVGRVVKLNDGKKPHVEVRGKGSHDPAGGLK